MDKLLAEAGFSGGNPVEALMRGTQKQPTTAQEIKAEPVPRE